MGILKRNIPDFININGQKKIVEFFGDYWHKDINRDKIRLKTYKKYGYETLVIWQSELDNMAYVEDKIREFI
jgi:G:T-mismatch repair DNA endonuclease (very short patch repair protein)